MLDALDALKASLIRVIRTALPVMLRQRVDAEATAFIGAEPHARTDARGTQHNGTRSKMITTPAGDVDLFIAKLRQDSFFASMLERRQRIGQVLFAVIIEAYVTGTSVRKVDNYLVKAFGADSRTSKSEVSRICAELDEQVAFFADRASPYWFVDATYCTTRVAMNGNALVVPREVVAATGFTSYSGREVLGFPVGGLEARVCPDCTPVLPQGPRRDRHLACDVRCPRPSEGGNRRGHARRRFAKVPVHFLRSVLAHVLKGSTSLTLELKYRAQADATLP